MAPSRAVGASYGLLPMEDSPTFSYSFCFWVYPRATSVAVTNLFRYGNQDTVRAPAVYFNANSLKLSVHVASENDLSWGVELPTPLSTIVWSHVALTVTETTLTVYVNGQALVSQNMPGSRRTYTGQNLYLGAAEQQAPNCLLSQFTFYDYDIGACGVRRVMGSLEAVFFFLSLFLALV